MLLFSKFISKIIEIQFTFVDVLRALDNCCSGCWFVSLNDVSIVILYWSKTTLTLLVCVVEGREYCNTVLV